MKLRSLSLSMLYGLVLAVLAATPALAAYTDPSGRVARVSYLDGDVSFSPAGEEEWVRAIINRPLIRGDRLWADRRSRVELQMGAAALRLDQLSSAEILDLDDDYAQFFLAEGSLNIYVRRIWENQVYEIATPTLAVVIRQPGSYRIDVDANGRHTDVTVWQGGAEAYGERASFNLREGEKVRFYDASLRDYRLLGSPRADNFDSFAFDRDRLMENSPSLRYVSDDLIGYTELDRYGSWNTHRDYGAVWFPTRVSRGWAPYRHGHWSWIEPFGWTWVDDASWGFAVSHYGRWVQVNNRWGWIPSPRNYRAVYAPALVAFVGGSNWSLSFSSGVQPVGWFPLGPRDIWFPSYRVSSGYFSRVNVHNTVINNVTVVNVYNNYYVRGGNLSQIDYRYRGTASAHTVVSQDVFTGGRPVQRGLISAARGSTARGEVQRLAPVAPTARSLVGTAQAAKSTPARGVFQRQAVTSRAPAGAAVSAPFRARQEALQRQPGEPLAVQARQAQAGSAASQRPLRVVGRDSAPVNRQQVSGRTSETARPATAREQGTSARRAPAAATQRTDAAQPARSATPRRSDAAQPARSATPRRSDAAQPARTERSPTTDLGKPARAAPQRSDAAAPARSSPTPRTAPARSEAPTQRAAPATVQPRSSQPTRQSAPQSSPARQPAQRSVQPSAPQVTPRSSTPARQAAPTPRQQQSIQRAPQQEQRTRQAELQRQSVERARASQQPAPRTQPAPQAAPRSQPAPQQRSAPPARAKSEGEAETEPRRRNPRERGRDDRGL